MSDQPPDLEPIDLSVSAPPTVTVSNGGAWAPGWYADPWTAGQYRYWTGQMWTGETSRWGPAVANVDAGSATDPWPSVGSSAGSGYGWPRPAETATAVAPSSAKRGAVIAGVVALVLVLLIAGVVGYAINSSSQPSSSDTVTPFPSAPGATTPASPGVTTPSGQAAPADPDSRALTGLVVKESDVNAARTVVLIPARQPTHRTDARSLQRNLRERGASHRAAAGRRRR